MNITFPNMVPAPTPEAVTASVKATFGVLDTDSPEEAAAKVEAQVAPQNQLPAQE